MNKRFKNKQIDLAKLFNDRKFYMSSGNIFKQ